MIIDCWGDGSCYNGRAGTKNSMGIGVIVRHSGKEFYLAKYVGLGTSNLAEWEALIHALRIAVPEALKFKEHTTIIYRADSQLIVNMFNGIYSHKKFKSEYRRAKYWENKLKENHRLDVLWIPRADNTEADELSRQGNPHYKG